MSRGPESGAGPDLVRWVEYMREIGVREMRCPSIRPVAGVGRGRPLPGAGPRSTSRPPHATRTGSNAPAAAAVKPTAGSPGPESVGGGSPELSGFPDPPPKDPAARLSQVRSDLGECTRCKLHPGRTKIVFGVGDPRARLMFVGEGPGADEDQQGEPFVGRAGRKLDEMIQAIGLERRQVYIANIVKCRPPQNRNPEPDEVETCSPFLIRQIEALRPRAIVTLGAQATHFLLQTKTGITRLRGQWHSFRGIPVMPTFHPAYLLRQYTPENRRKVWEDLKAARQRVDESV